MAASRRPHYNFGLQRAAEWADHLRKPLLVFEALRAGYEWHARRFHAFVLDGMADHAAAFAAGPATYRAYVEPEAGAGKGLLAALAEQACVVVTDDYPCFFLPRAVDALGRQVSVRMEVVDGNGLYPMRATDRVFTTAHSFRAHLQKQLPDRLLEMPKADPLAGLELPTLVALPAEIRKRWSFERPGRHMLDHVVGLGAVPETEERGGWRAGKERTSLFIQARLDRYGQDRNSPDSDGASGVSPFLHFGHVGAHQVFAEIVEREDWELGRLGVERRGAREGWWGMSPGAESFLDELVTWREIGFNRCALTDDYDRFESLPGWAKVTLREHAGDVRPYLYTFEEFDRALTHDELWNAAQRQLVREGRMHNYLRMLWGKKILEWTETPRDALAVMLELNNRYALDGRDPNSYSGIFWVLGRYDRAWGPEREVFGKIRFMSSDSTRRKLSVKGYLQRYAATAAGTGAAQGSLFE